RVCFPLSAIALAVWSAAKAWRAGRMETQGSNARCAMSWRIITPTRTANLKCLFQLNVLRNLAYDASCEKGRLFLRRLADGFGSPGCHLPYSDPAALRFPRTGRRRTQP